jgi:hypothetical protein
MLHLNIESAVSTIHKSPDIYLCSNEAGTVEIQEQVLTRHVHVVDIDHNTVVVCVHNN